jgi:hypothetical protein
MVLFAGAEPDQVDNAAYQRVELKLLIDNFLVVGKRYQIADDLLDVVYFLLDIGRWSQTVWFYQY